jgi:hypothetical protein
MSTELKKQVTRAENERCRCIAEQDFPALRKLLSSRLIHVHTRGNQDTRDSYLDYLGVSWPSRRPPWGRRPRQCRGESRPNEAGH